MLFKLYRDIHLHTDQPQHQQTSCLLVMPMSKLESHVSLSHSYNTAVRELACVLQPRRARASLAQSLKESSSEDDEVQSVETVESAPPSEDSDDDYE